MATPLEPLRIFIGYDPREAVAYHVLSHSIITRASVPVQITPLVLGQLAGMFRRPRDPRQSTDFAFSRFLVPALCNYEGWALFMDCDMLVLDDISKLWALRDSAFAVMVVKHDYTPKNCTKFLSQPQSIYPKKNWSSVMLFNNAACGALTPATVSEASGLELHQFRWLADERLIGELPSQWNHLVGEFPPRHDASVLHFTNGGPYFDAYRACEYSELWFSERNRMLEPDRCG